MPLYDYFLQAALYIFLEVKKQKKKHNLVSNRNH